MKWSRLRRNEKQFLLVCIAPIVSILMISLVIMFTIGAEVGTFVAFMLFTAWMIFGFTYIVIDSKSAWPEASAFQRFANAITFKR